ncbi:PAQR family membrane homeostasis protein TrhA, partial [Mycolicibacterium poriferae]
MHGIGDLLTVLLVAPRARGWIHLVTAVAAAAAGVGLLMDAWVSSTPRAVGAVLVYVVGIVAMFGISATYHRVRWGSVVAEKWMMRLDHSAIFVFIAASYTPLAILAMPPDIGADVLTIVWIGAGVGVILKMCWPSAPRWA